MTKQLQKHLICKRCQKRKYKSIDLPLKFRYNNLPCTSDCPVRCTRCSGLNEIAFGPSRIGQQEYYIFFLEVIKCQKNRKALFGREKVSLVIYLPTPWIIGLVCFHNRSIFASFFLSFTTYDGINPPKLIGFMNYKILLHWIQVFESLGQYILLHGWVRFLKSSAWIDLCSLLNNAGKFMGVFRTIFLPVVLPAIPVMFLWMMLFNPSSGLINQFLGVFGINGPLWLNSPNLVKP